MALFRTLLRITHPVYYRVADSLEDARLKPEKQPAIE